jgi:uncharacterized membrane protein
MSRLIASGLLALALAAAVVLPAAPCLRGPGGLHLAAVVYAGGGVVCHQRADRSLSICGRSWPVCGRCSGLYLGAAAGAVLALAGVGWTAGRRQWQRRLLWAAAPTAVSWIGEMAGLGDPGTPLRLALAVPLGLTTALWLAEVARGHLR